jgi:hypothetical protein
MEQSDLIEGTTMFIPSEELASIVQQQFLVCNPRERRRTANLRCLTAMESD